LWPRSTVSLRRILARFDVDSYDVQLATPGREAAA
jgi:hypothetical protein